MRTKLNNFRCEVKERICQLLTDIYREQHNGELPKWFDDEEIVVDDSTFTPTIRIGVVVDDDVEYPMIEKWAINEYRVTLDYNLMFRCGEMNNEFEWTELTTDELVLIYDMINKSYDFKKSN